MTGMRILCFGDSNTYGYDPRSYFGGRYPAEHRWVDLLAQKTGHEVLNAGANGREIPKRSTEAYGLDVTVDLLVIMLGSNDLLQGNDVTTGVSRMEVFLTQLSSERERILLVAPPPMKLGAWVQQEHLITDSFELGEAYRRLAQKMGIHFANAGAWDIDLTFDGIHFSEKGHRAFAVGLHQTLIGFLTKENKKES